MGRLGAALALTLVVCWSAAARPPHLPRLLAPADTTARDTLAADSTAADSTTRDTTDRDSTARDATRAARPALGDTLARRDTLASADSLAGADSLARGDSLSLADSLALADTGRAAAYLGPFRRRSTGLFGRPVSLLDPRAGTGERRTVTLDSTGRRYVARYDDPLSGDRYPLALDAEGYRLARQRMDMSDTWRELAEQRRRQRNRRGGLGINIVVPGGRQSAFSTIFGKPEVDLRITGNADVDAGFNYRQSDQQGAITGNDTQVDPNFQQNLRLGIIGSIGDKMQINVNWDTQNEFDYENQVQLKYTGYEDEIIQSVEAGNVFLETPSQLINGGQSLFGIKSRFRLGDLTLTTIASQQEGQAETLSIESGSQTSTFSLKPTDYDANRHFFLGYFFRNVWNDAHAQPPLLLRVGGFERITDIEVWKQRVDAAAGDQDVRRAVAFVDLAESPDVVTDADGFTNQELPFDLGDRYDSPALLDSLRDGDIDIDLAARFDDLTENDFAKAEFIKLEQGVDYTLDPVLGYISLKQSLRDEEGLAVAYRYARADGTTPEVGDLTDTGGGTSGGQSADRLVLKLLRPSRLVQPDPDGGVNPAAWYLQMRNIYSLQGRGFTEDNFDLQINYAPPGQPESPLLPEVTGQTPLIQTLGFDRLNQDQAPRPDNEFDFNATTIDPGEGLLIFPYLEPFGARLRRVIEEGGGTPQQVNQFVFSSLYTRNKTLAETETEYDVYRIQGEYKGGVQSFYDLQAFTGLIEGSVSVVSGGQELQEGTDYVVDYQGGTVTITNPQYLANGRDIQIDYEQNTFANLQQRTLLGARADWTRRDRYALGATAFRLSERSPVDKYRIGEEPIRNFIWGVDGSVSLEPRWLTRAVDALPLVQTKEASAINLSGEFAQLRPGHTDTRAFERARNDLQALGRDYGADELGGVSFVDDFEGFENSFSLRQPLNWRLASAPAASLRRPMGPSAGDDSLRTTWRGVFAWYQVNRNIFEQLDDGVTRITNPEAVAPVDVRDVFPNRDTRGEADPTITTLDLFFDPSARGPYNYTTELETFLANPKDVWGGFTQPVPDGYNDFSIQNIEFVEFIMRPFAEGAPSPSRDARLYLNLGSISEDVLPNRALNLENGLSTDNAATFSIDAWGRVPQGTPGDALVIDGDRTNDLGLDGLVSYNPGAYAPELDESTQFADFLAALPAGGDARTRAEVARARRDPSGDDYQFFGNDNYFLDGDLYPGGVLFQERFARYYAGPELNGYETLRALGRDGGRGVTRQFDTEDLNANRSFDPTNNYYEYSLPLDLDSLDLLAAPDRTDDYVVGEIQNPDTGEGTGWYQVRIPVRDFQKRVGDIQDFSRIESLRLWTTGHEVPLTLRLATLDLVGSQWRVSQAILEEEEQRANPIPDDAVLSVASINNEEDAIYVPPPGVIISQNRNTRGAQQNAREQSLVLRTENLAPGRQRGVFKAFGQGLNLLKYTNLRMYAHVHGTLASGAPFSSLPEDEARQRARLFVRLGSDETTSYYEYEQPLTPTDPTVRNGELLWRPDANSMNIELAALNQLKVARDASGAPTDTLFWNVGDDGALRDGAPDAEAFAPPGTRLAIKGTPSLQTINTVIIGIRNGAAPVPRRGGPLQPATLPGDTEATFREVVLWVNELRVAGYDERPGWSALANADIELADFGRVRTSYAQQTDGFGDLNSTLSQRNQVNTLNWSVTTDLNVDALLPERQGWQIPVSVNVQATSSTPRFDPNRGDVRLEEVLSQIDDRSDLSDEEKEARRAEAQEAAETRTLTRSITGTLSKQGSTNDVLRYTLDATTLNVTYSDQSGRSPTNVLDDSWRWTGTFDYRLDFGRPRTVRPLGPLGDVPVLGVLGGLAFNYVPQSLNFSASANRSVTRRRTRPSPIPNRASTTLPERLANPFQENQNFTHRRSFGLQYNPFEFLNLSFDTSTDQTLNAVGADTLSTVIVVDPDDATQITQTLPGLTIQDAIADGRIDSTLIDSGRVFQEDRLLLNSERAVAQRLFFGDGSPRTESYQQRATATLRPSLLRAEAFNWIDLQDVTYDATFQWQNGQVGTPVGASAGVRTQIRSGVTFHPNAVWERFGFYRRLKEAQQEADAERQRERDRRRAEAARRRQEERERREAEARRAREAEATRGEGADEEDGGDASGDDAAEGGAKEDGPPEGDARPPAGAPPTAAADSTGGDADEDGGGGGGGPPDLPLPDPVALLRRAALTFTDIRDVSITYTGARGGQSSNVGRLREDGSVGVDYSLLDALQGQGPSLGYRLGFQRRIGRTQRVLDEQRQASDVLTNDNQLQARTTLAPSDRFQIQLNWGLSWNTNRQITFRPLEDGGFDSFRTQDGGNTVTVWSFGGSYRAFFEQQLATYVADLNAASPSGGEGAPSLGDENGDGRVVLTNASAAEDFRAAYLRGSGPIGQNGFLPLPMPNWTINYSGLSGLPLVRRLTQSVNLSHSYSSEFTSGFNAVTASDTVRTFPLSGQTIAYTPPDFEISTAQISELFQPLAGLDVSWKGNIQTNLSFNRRNRIQLGTSNFEVTEAREREISGAINFRVRGGIRLPFFARRLNNQLTLGVQIARATIDEQRYSLRRALEEAGPTDPGSYDPAFATEGDNVAVINQTTRLTLAPTIGYRFSNRVEVNFQLQYEKFDGDARQPSYTEINGGFQVSVNVSEN